MIESQESRDFDLKIAFLRSARAVLCNAIGDLHCASLYGEAGNPRTHVVREQVLAAEASLGRLIHDLCPPHPENESGERTCQCKPENWSRGCPTP